MIVVCQFFFITVKAQPRELPLRYIQIPKDIDLAKDEKGRIIFYEFIKDNDVITLKDKYFNEHFERVISPVKNNVINIPLEAYKPSESIMLGLHFFNNNKEDVYIYTHFPIKESLGFVFGENDTISFGKMDLEKGTYLLDWDDKSNSYKKIENNIYIEKIYFERAITELDFPKIYEKIKYYRDNNDTKGSADSLHFYENIYKERKAIADKLETDYNNNSDRYSGYFIVKKKLNEMAHSFDLYGSWRPASHEGLNIKIDITEKALKEYKLSNEPISPKEIERYYKIYNIEKPTTIKKILSVFKS